MSLFCCKIPFHLTSFITILGLFSLWWKKINSKFTISIRVITFRSLPELFYYMKKGGGGVSAQ